MFFEGVGPDSNDEELAAHRAPPPGVPLSPAQSKRLYQGVHQTLQGRRGGDGAHG